MKQKLFTTYVSSKNNSCFQENNSCFHKNNSCLCKTTAVCAKQQLFAWEIEIFNPSNHTLVGWFPIWFGRPETTWFSIHHAIIVCTLHWKKKNNLKFQWMFVDEVRWSKSHLSLTFQWYMILTLFPINKYSLNFQFSAIFFNDCASKSKILDLTF